MEQAASGVSVGIVGLGYVGLPLAVEFAEAGHQVVALDADASKVAALAAGRATSRTSPPSACRASRDRLHPTTRYADLAQVDAIVIAVPTPLNENREPDLQPLVSAGAALASVLQEGQLVVLESTTYPGTTRERLAPLLEESGLRRRAHVQPRLLARAHRPGPHRLHAAHHPEGRRRPHAGVPGARASPSTRRSATPSCRSRRSRSRSSPSCSRTSSARSTSRSSTRSRCSATA